MAAEGGREVYTIGKRSGLRSFGRREALLAYRLTDASAKLKYLLAWRFPMTRWVVHCCALILLVFTLSCAKTPSEQAAKHEVRGDGYVQQEQFREAMIEFKNAVRAAPDNPSLQWKLAKAALKGGDPSTAYQALGRVVQLDPSHFEAKWSLGDLYLAGGKMDEVGKIAEELVSAQRPIALVTPPTT